MYTKRTQAITSVGHFVPVVDEILQDVPQVEMLLSNDLRAGVMERIDNQLLNGNGTDPNITGMYNKTGKLDQALQSGDDITTTVFRAVGKLHTEGRARPNLLIMHPNNWFNVVADRYITAASGDDTYKGPRLNPGIGRWENWENNPWGIPTIVTTAASSATAVLVDTRFMAIRDRQSVSLEMGYIDDDFKKMQMSLRAVARLAFYITRAKAVCTISGLDGV